MTSRQAFAVSAVFGAAVGYASTFTILETSWIAVVPWGLLALGVGIMSNDRKAALWNGAAFGYFMSLAFLIGSFHGANDKLGSFTLFAFVLSAFGGACGLMLAWLGHYLRKMFG